MIVRRRSRLLLAILLAWHCTGADGEGRCSVSAQDLRFGSYDVFSARPTLATAVITVECGTARAMQLGIAGRTLGSNEQSRTLSATATGSLLHYRVSLAPRSSPSTGVGAAAARRGYQGALLGEIAPHQDVPVGFYTDSIRLLMLP